MKMKLLILLFSGLFSIFSIAAQDTGDRAWYIADDYEPSNINADELMDWEVLGTGEISAVSGQA